MVMQSADRMEICRKVLGIISRKFFRTFLEAPFSHALIVVAAESGGECGIPRPIETLT